MSVLINPVNLPATSSNQNPSLVQGLSSRINRCSSGYEIDTAASVCKVVAISSHVIGSIMFFAGDYYNNDIVENLGFAAVITGVPACIIAYSISCLGSKIYSLIKNKERTLTHILDKPPSYKDVMRSSNQRV